MHGAWQPRRMGKQGANPEAFEVERRELFARRGFEAKGRNQESGRPRRPNEGG